MLSKVNLALKLLRHFGAGWMAYRLFYSGEQKLGLLQIKMPASRWSDHALEDLLERQELADPEAYLEYRYGASPAFFFRPEEFSRSSDLLRVFDDTTGSVLPQAENVVNGVIKYFGNADVRVGFPPSWCTNPYTLQTLPADSHWSAISDFDNGDIKLVWELGRFAFVYSLVRAYWRNNDERYTEAFWRLAESWRTTNPPNQGPHWKCGQEISFRVMAWIFGLYGFLRSPATTAERVSDLVQMIAVSGKRIEGNISYALSQKNNHAISEGVGLFTIATLFPELKDAARWREKGHTILETAGRELIYEDGAFSQHSTNYHRLVLHDYLWLLRLADLNGERFSDELRERVHKAGDFLYEIQDRETGQVPNYGHNDGALILPLSNCDFLDFRPVVQAVHYYFAAKRRFEHGPWDEDLFWLFGCRSLPERTDARESVDLKAESAGYYTLRTDRGFAFIRCAAYRHRPGQADMLHLDLWWRGRNIAIDPGTYSYNAPPPWGNPFSGTLFHNTVTVDGYNQMERAERFMWLPWVKGCVRFDVCSPSRNIRYWEGEHDGYTRLPHPVRHRRAVLRIGPEHWMVCDGLASNGAHSYLLQWLLSDARYTYDAQSGSVDLELEGGPYCVRITEISGTPSFGLVRADAHSPRGWHSPYYHCRKPALSLTASAHGESSMFLTCFGPELTRFSRDGNLVRLQTRHWECTATIANTGPGRNAPLLSAVEIKGDASEHFKVS